MALAQPSMESLLSGIKPATQRLLQNRLNWPLDGPLVPPYRAGPMSTAGGYLKTRGSLVRVERIGYDGAICADVAQRLPPPYEGRSQRLCRV